MFIVLLCVLIYAAIGLGFCLWDAFIGMPVDWGNRYSDTPPLALAACFWPIALPIILMIVFTEFLQASKNKRITKENMKQKLRVAAEAEEAELIKQVEEEILHERKSSH